MPGAASDLMVDILNIWPGGRIAEGPQGPLSTSGVQDETLDHLGDPVFIVAPRGVLCQRLDPSVALPMATPSPA